MFNIIEQIFGYAALTFIVYIFALSCYWTGKDQGSFYIGLFGWWLFAIPIEFWLHRDDRNHLDK
jgi:hypothetical protein